MAVGDRAIEPRQLRHRHYAALGLGLDAWQVRLQNPAIHGSWDGRGRVRRWSKQPDHHARTKWFSRENHRGVGRNARQSDLECGTTKSFRRSRARIDRTAVFARNIRGRLREAVARGRAIAKRFTIDHHATRISPVEL